MIGPAARRHFLKSLQAAEEAERNIIPGQLYDRALKPLAMALVHMIKGVAFVFLSSDVEIKLREDEK